ncbi:Conserved hypothetical protein [gamma proteobacterium HdN1]|nr:Conserved hypothetical protein [gamma proteobacterium HdN1]
MPNSLSPLLDHPSIWRASRILSGPMGQVQPEACIPSGYDRLDRELPDGGWPKQGIVELLLPRWGLGEMSLFTPALTQLGQQNRWLAWIAPPWIPYAPALERAGIPTQHLLLVRTHNLADTLWAMEQCLKSGACAIVFGWPQNLRTAQIRRLHLAGQDGQCLGVLMRDQRHAQSASPAPLRVEIKAPSLTQHGGLHCNLRLLKRRGNWASDWFSVALSAPLLQD